MMGLRLARITKPDQKRLMWLINSYRKAAKVLIFAKPPMKNRLAGTMVSQAICSPKTGLSPTQESRSFDRLFSYGDQAPEVLEISANVL